MIAIRVWIEEENKTQTGIFLVSIKDKKETLGISYGKLEAEVRKRVKIKINSFFCIVSRKSFLRSIFPSSWTSGIRWLNTNIGTKGLWSVYWFSHHHGWNETLSLILLVCCAPINLTFDLPSIEWSLFVMRYLHENGSKMSHCSRHKVCLDGIREQGMMKNLSIQLHVIHALMIYDVKM